MKRYRRLRRLQPDEQLLRRRASGEPLRPLAVDYRVSHTSLGRYFARPDVAKEIKQTQRLLRAEDKLAWARKRDQLETAQQTAADAQQAGAGGDDSDHGEEEQSQTAPQPTTLQERGPGTTPAG